MAAGNTGEAPIARLYIGQLPGRHTQPAVHLAVIEAVVLARVEGHAAVQTVTLGLVVHLDQPRTVIETEASSQDLVEYPDDPLVHQHPPEWLAPRPLKGQWVLAKFAAPGRRDQIICPLRQPRLAFLHQV